MKKGILIIISLLIFSNVVWAQKAPDGFLGIKWGTTLEEFKKTAIFTECGVSKFTLFPACGKWKKIGDAPVSDYSFLFTESDISNLGSGHQLKDKFYSVQVRFPKDISFDVFLDALTEKYGKPASVKPLVLKINPNAKVGMRYMWLPENKVTIALEYQDMEDAMVSGSLTYVYRPIYHQFYKEPDVKKTKDKL